MSRDRASFFVDGSNWYHGCLALGLRRLGRLNYARVCRKLAQHRRWVLTRYYVGRVPRTGNVALADEQAQFLDTLVRQDSRIAAVLGRLERRTVKNDAADELKRYLGGLRLRIPAQVFGDLLRIAEAHAQTTVMVEKAVDVQIAVDIVTLAERDEYDIAYLLSADGDLTPAVEFARSKGKRVIVASPLVGARLTSACDLYIRLRREWFEGLFE